LLHETGYKYAGKNLLKSVKNGFWIIFMGFMCPLHPGVMITELTSSGDVASGFRWEMCFITNGKNKGDCGFYRWFKLLQLVATL
jgi:hypothetical protein